MSTALSSSAHQRLTRYFIDQNPITVTLRRSAVTATGTGGKQRGPESIVGDVTGRLVATSYQNDGNERMTASGALVLPSYKLITMPDEDIQLHDTFTLNGRRHEVVGFISSPPWRINAEVFVHVQ